MKNYTQAELSEIMFHFHLDQAASHMQGMTVTLPMTANVVKDFNFLKTILNRIWRTQDAKLKIAKPLFEEQASKMDTFLQMFLKVEDQHALLKFMQKLIREQDTSNETIVINRAVVKEQQKHLHVRN